LFVTDGQRAGFVARARADRALSAAKDAGRDRIHADGPTTVEAAAP
jgi:GGDEF domain-containing protein